MRISIAFRIDCKDGAILIASLLINAGIPSWRVKVAGGGVLPDPLFAPSDTELAGHAWCIYLADRPDSKRGLEWIILDWCYSPDPDVPIEEKPLAKNGGQQGGYKETVIDGKTGKLIDDITPEKIVKVIRDNEHLKCNPKDCREQARKFDVKRFAEEIRKEIRKD